MADGDLPVDSACQVQDPVPAPLPNSVNSAFRAGLSDRDMLPSSSSPPNARQLADLFTDGRGHSIYPGPSKQARLADVAKSPGAHIARSEDGSSCVVAAHAVLQIIRVNNSAANGTNIELGSKNFWSTGGVSNDRSPTDVVWAHGNWSSKIITSSRSGEIYMWDINKAVGSKCEHRLQLPATRRRPINKLAYSPRSLNMVAAGAHDGHVHLYDFRHLETQMPSLSFNASGSGSAVRALVLSPVATDPHLAIIGLDNGTLQRWDLRSANRPMETVRLAHMTQVLGMDWLPPPTADRGHGWLATCGMDKTIKLWDLSGTSLPSTPSRTLHASYPVRRVFFRPKHDTEVIAVPQLDHELPVEIWDVRREWLPKWTLQPAGEGDVHDLVPADAHSLWAIHASGAFVQHDLRSQPVSSRPSSVGSKLSMSSASNQPASGLWRTVDDIPRGTVAWDPNGTIVFVAHKEDRFELPYDDVHPEQRPLITARGMRYKCPADPAISGLPPSQTLGTAVVPTASADGSGGGGVRYVLDLSVGRERVCELNAQIAADAEQWRAAQTWEMVRSLLADLHPPETPMPSPPPPTRPQSPPSSVSDRRREQPTPRSQHASPAIVRRASPVSLRPSSPQVVKTPARSLRKQASEDQELVRQASPIAFRTPGRPASPQVVKTTAQSRRQGSDEQEKEEQRDVVTILPSPMPRRDSATSSVSGSRRDSSSVSSLRGDSGDDSFTLPTPGMLERRSSTVSLLSDSSSSRGSRRSPLPLGPRPSAVRRPSIIAAAEHAFSAPTVLTLAAIGGGTTSVTSAAGTSGIVGSPAVSSLLKHAGGTMGGRPNIIATQAMRIPRSGRSTPNSSNPGSPLKHVVELGNGNGNSDNMMSRSVSAPTMASTSITEPIFMSSSISIGALASASTSSRPRPVGRGRKPSLRGGVKVPESLTSYESASVADDEGESSAGSAHGFQPSSDTGADSGDRPRKKRRPRSGTLGAPGRRTLTKQESHASIRTVVAASPPRAEQKLATSEDDEAHAVETPIPQVEVIEASSGSLGLALGPLARRDESLVQSSRERGAHVESKASASERKVELETPSEDSVNEYANVLLSETVRRAVRLDEDRYRQIGWAAVREELEYYAEKGDVQMCAHLATVAPDELLLAPLRVEQFVKAYVELLERSRMHTQAAYIRKHCTVPTVRERTQLHTSISLSCGRCKKPLEGSSFLESQQPAGVRSFTLCRSCRQGGARCSICRLPVQGLMILCPVCTHGGHQDCMRKYYPQQPMRAMPQPDLPAHPGQHVHAHLHRDASPHQVSLLTAAAPSRAGSMLSTTSTSASATSTYYTADSSEKERDREEPRERTRPLMGHPCAAGCGHFCWVANDMPQALAAH
ncbi:hypothetical protein AURDEDRAFT_186730 [Auricularia subglabra TFB-10046 SS5]|nr:hypothetical protein AURDEDRAFT_186730 [Auricularia subglabra TFB-10046 SS5]